MNLQAKVEAVGFVGAQELILRNVLDQVAGRWGRDNHLIVVGGVGQSAGQFREISNQQVTSVPATRVVAVPSAKALLPLIDGLDPTQLAVANKGVTRNVDGRTCVLICKINLNNPQ